MLKVFCYFNLHRKCFSIKALEGPNKGRVVAHSDKVLLSDGVFKVSEAGRQRVLRERKGLWRFKQKETTNEVK